jgi:hypothetical protein
VPKTAHEFHVSHTVVSAASVVFEKMLDPDSPFKEATVGSVDLLEDHPGSIEVWFKLLHSVNDLASTYSKTSITGVWEFLDTAHKYAIDPTQDSAKMWFANWYDHQKHQEFNYEDYQSLLFPCHTFNHAKGFAAATEYLVYNTDRNITEQKPLGYEHDHLRLDQRVIRKFPDS